MELIEQRDDHTRVWEIVREVETRHPDGSTTVDTVKSQIHEKGSGLCYPAQRGQFVPAVAEWRESPDGFVIDCCAYGLSVGNSIASGLGYAIDGHELILRPAYLMISDGVNEAHVAVLNSEAAGSVAAGSPSVLRFPAAFGPGYDLEYVAEKGGFHQNLIIAQPPDPPAGFDLRETWIYLYTEINLDSYLAASGLEVLVEGQPLDTTTPDLLSPPSRGGSISFCRVGRILHAFSISRVTDSSRPGALDRQTMAEKRLMKDPSTGAAYLVESIPLSCLGEDGLCYPVVWDYEQKSGSITQDETWEPKITYWVTSNLQVSSATLTILPGTTVKLNPDTSINIMTDGQVAARGDPYNYITFTKAEDDNCGEPIPGAPQGGWDRVLDISTGSYGESVIQYCRFGHGNIAVFLRESLSEQVAHNVFRETNYAMQIWYCSATVHDNLMTDCYFYAISAFSMGTGVFTNNTFDCAMIGIRSRYASDLTATDNIFASCCTAIDTLDYSYAIDYNAYLYSGGTRYGDNNVELTADPFYGYGPGPYFLNDYGAGELSDAGSRDAEHPEVQLHQEVFAIRAPFPASGTQSGQVTWKKICYDDEGQPYSIDTGVVCIGYHHCRVDRYIADNYTISGAASVLTIKPGVVVGIHPDKYLIASGGAKLLSEGNPSGGGLNLFTNRKSLSMNIESPRFAQTFPIIWIYDSASAQSCIQFTRTAWLGWGVLIGPTLDEPIRHNVFSLSHHGMQSSPEGNALLNNLMHDNIYGAHAAGASEIANCTFDRNDTGIRVSGGSGETLLIRDSLFTKNSDEGILIYSGAENVVDYYNAFWQNGENIDGKEELGPGSLVLIEPPYYAAIESGWQLHYKLKQDDGWPFTTSPINAGSRWAPDPLDGPHPYSTCDYAKRDVGRIDIGFHFTFYENTDGDSLPDAWETHYFEHLDEGDSSDGNGDGVTAIQEFWHGSSPLLADTDSDGHSDDEEVGPQASVEASRKLCRGWGPALYDFKAGPWLTNPTWSQETSWGVTIGWWVPDGLIPKDLYYKTESESSFTRVYGKDIATRDHAIEGKVYEKTLTGPSGGTVYQYYVQCRIGDTDRKSPVCKFRTLESSPSSFSFIVYGDSRSCPSTDWRHMAGHNNNGFNEYTARVARGILSKVPGAAFLLHVGDYPENQAGGAETAEHWRQHFFLPSTRLVAEYPLFAALGNHERGYSGAGLKYFQDFFDYPGDLNPDDPSGVLVRYSFDYANCRFICLDTNDPETFDEQKNDFLIPLLSGAGGKRVFVWFHHPPFSSGPNGSGSPSTDVKDTFVSVFQQYGAKMVFGGHDHIYERVVCTEQGNTVRYIVTGGAGAPLSTGVENYQYPAPNHGAVQEKLYDRSDEPQQDAFHFCVLEVTPSSFNLKAYKWDGAQKDYWP